MVAPRVARVLAVLDEHPSLVWGPVPGVEWLALRDGRAPLPEGVEQGRAEGWRALGPLPVEPHVMQVRALGARQRAARDLLSAPVHPCSNRCRTLCFLRRSSGPPGLYAAAPALHLPCHASHRDSRGALPSAAPQHVYELFQLVNAVQHMSMFAFVVRPQILLAGSVHLHAVSAIPSPDRL